MLRRLEVASEVLEEREIFNKVLEDAVSLLVQRKVAGYEFRLYEGELISIYEKHLDPNDIPLFNRFTKYLTSPEGREFFNKMLRLKLWEAGFRPKGWEETPDTMFFNVPEAREQLIREGHVYTLRPRMRKTGWDVAYYGSYYKKEKIGDVWVVFVKEIKDIEELKPYFHASGFKKLADWWEAAEGSRFLFRVSFKRWERP